VTRRSVFALAAAFLGSRPAGAFGQDGAFQARLLKTAGTAPLGAARESALGRWGWELVRRTSAPGRLLFESVAADSPQLLDQPFCVWAGGEAVQPLMGTERRGLAEFFQLGGMLLVDDSSPEIGAFGATARKELARVMPEVPITRVPERHVLFKSYYLVARPQGRVLGPPYLEAMIRGGGVQVLFSSHDILGALARDTKDAWSFPVEGDDLEARQRVIRLAVNIAMYVLCSDYKDDQVHAGELMRRRGRASP
jgi:Domain of unknown function (DUF4159)